MVASKERCVIFSKVVSKVATLGEISKQPTSLEGHDSVPPISHTQPSFLRLEDNGVLGDLSPGAAGRLITKRKKVVI